MNASFLPRTSARTSARQAICALPLKRRPILVFLRALVGAFQGCHAFSKSARAWSKVAAVPDKNSPGSDPG